MKTFYIAKALVLSLTLICLFSTCNLVFAQSINTPSVPRIEPVKVNPVITPRQVQVNAVIKPEPVKESEPVVLPVTNRIQSFMIKISNSISTAVKDFFNSFFPETKPIKTPKAGGGLFNINIKPIGPIQRINTPRI